MAQKTSSKTTTAGKRRSTPPPPDKLRRFEPFQFRWQNIRSLCDTGWLEVRPLTVIIGPNGSGKTSLISPLLLLKQSLQTTDRAQALNTRAPLFNAGSFEDLIHNHDLSRKVSFALRFHRHDLPEGKEVAPPPAYPPGEIELTFSADPHSDGPALDSYVARDTYGRELLRRHRQADGSYDLGDMSLVDVDEDIERAIRASVPRRFLFTNEPLDVLFTRNVPVHKGRSKKVDGRSERFQIEALKVPQAAVAYFSTVSVVTHEIDQLVSKIRFIGPLRQHPLRIYELSGEHPSNVGTRGENAPELLFRNRSKDLLDRVNTWVQKFEFGVTLGCEKVSNEAFTITLTYPNDMKLNLADTGFGLSQVLPVIVQCMSMPSGGMLIAEQPEIHLNPRLQGVLAELFAEVINVGSAIIVETHSEHLLLRLRRLVADGKIKESDVSLLYSERDGLTSTVRPIPVDRIGHIESGQWPKGFFEDSLKEALALATSQSKARRSNAR